MVQTMTLKTLLEGKGGSGESEDKPVRPLGKFRDPIERFKK